MIHSIETKVIPFLHSLYFIPSVERMKEIEHNMHFITEISSIVSEGDKPGTYVATVSASDEDKDSLTYSFVGKYPHFMIDPKEGIIQLRTMVDREKTDSFIILVRAFDGQRTSTATVSVSIDDVNEKPIFKTNLYE